MKRIPLTQGKEAIVDDCDYEYLVQWKWQYRKDSRSNSRVGYAGRSVYVPGEGQHPILMHRVVAERMGLDIDGFQVDHKATSDLNNKLNNRRNNLRIATPTQNQTNSIRCSRNKSGFKGVCWHRINQLWTAQIRIDGKQNYLGSFPSAVEAARAYNLAALKHFGEFAVLNAL